MNMRGMTLPEHLVVWKQARGQGPTLRELANELDADPAVVIEFLSWLNKARVVRAVPVGPRGDDNIPEMYWEVTERYRPVSAAA